VTLSGFCVRVLRQLEHDGQPMQTARHDFYGRSLLMSESSWCGGRVRACLIEADGRAAV
jgi:hypothetical protein